MREDLSHHKGSYRSVLGGQGRTAKDVKASATAWLLMAFGAVFCGGVICGLLIGAML